MARGRARANAGAGVHAGRAGVVRPTLLWFVLLDGGIVILAKLTLSRTSYNKARDLAGDALPPREVLQTLLAGTAVIHVTEALIAGRIARRRGLPAKGWRRQTLIVGFPSLLALRRATRIDPVD